MLIPKIKYVKSTQSETLGTFTSEFQNAMETFGRQIMVRIYVNNELTYENEDIFSLKRFVDTSLLKTVMYTIECEIGSINDFAGSNITDVQFGVTVDGDTYYFVSFGAYEIFESQMDFEKHLTKVTAYDGMLKAMKEYDNTIPQYPCTNYEYLVAIAQAIGLTVGNSIPSDGVMAFTRSTETYTNKYTYRDIFEDFAEILGGCITVKDGSLELLSVTDTGKTITETSLKTMTVKEEYPTVTNVILSRQPQEDNVAYVTEETNGSEIKLLDNLLAEGAARVSYLSPLLARYQAWGSFYVFESNTFGYVLFEPCDIFTLSLEGNVPKRVLWLSHELQVNQGVTESAKSSAPDATKTDYSKTTNDAKKDLDTYLYVDKVAGTITSRVENIESNVGNSVTSITYYYLIKEEGITPEADDADWSTTQITEHDVGEIIWRKTVLTLADNTSYVQAIENISGRDGVSGVGVDRVVVEFYLSGSNTSLGNGAIFVGESTILGEDTYPSIGTWTENPEYEDETYCWKRYVTYYTDGSVSYGTPVLDSELTALWGTVKTNRTEITQTNDRITSWAERIVEVEGTVLEYQWAKQWLDATGLHVQTSDTDTQTNITGAGLEVLDPEGNTVMKAKGGEVEASNLTAKTHLRIAADNVTSRFQQFYSTVHDEYEFGVFWEVV